MDFTGWESSGTSDTEDEDDEDESLCDSEDDTWSDPDLPERSDMDEESDGSADEDHVPDRGNDDEPVGFEDDTDSLNDPGDESCEHVSVALNPSSLKWTRQNSEQTFCPRTKPFDDSQERFCNGILDLPENSSPLQFLRSFMTDGIIQNVLEESNSYATTIRMSKPKALKKWTDVTTNELWTFIGLHLLMGIVQKPTLKDYWSTDELLFTPAFGKHMPRERYERILRTLHFSDNQRSKKDTKLWKLGVFLPTLIENFRGSINLGKDLCIDESLLAFKGRLSFKQYMPLKRSRFGIKYFSLVDSSTGFLADLKVYLGKGTGLDPSLSKQLGLGGSTVVSLLLNHLRKGHKVVVDNYFNSPLLQNYLHELDTYLLGTVRKERKGMPKWTNKLVAGECEVYYTENLMLERWKDRREVLMLSSFLEHEMLESVSTNPRNTRAKPNSVLIYNKRMGGVDSIDQMLASYSSHRRSIKWYKKFALHLIDLAVYNAFVSYNYCRTTAKLMYKDFLLTLIRNIFSTFRIQRASLGRPPSLPCLESKENHYPVEVRKNRKQSRSNCVVCHAAGKRRATAYKCGICKKRLCVKGSPSCFALFHDSTH